MEYIALIIAGIIISSLASLVGIAGGIMWVPYLILAQNLEARHAVMLSFLIQVFGMGSATFAHIRKKNIYWNLALGIGPFIFSGMLLGAFLSERVVKSDWIEISMGGLIMSIAFLFTIQQENYDAILNEDRKTQAPIKMKWMTSGFAVISGFFSVGIGDFVIPFFRGKLKIPMQNTIGTALFLNFFLAASGGISHLLLTKNYPDNFVNLLSASAFGVIIGGQIGPRISTFIDEGKLKEIFIFVLLLVGLHTIYQAL